MTLKFISTFQLLKSLQPAHIIHPGEMTMNPHCLCQAVGRRFLDLEELMFDFMNQQFCH